MSFITKFELLHQYQLIPLFIIFIVGLYPSDQPKSRILTTLSHYTELKGRDCLIPEFHQGKHYSTTLQFASS